MRLIDADALIVELQKDEELFDKEAENVKDDPSYTEEYSDVMWSRANGIRDAIIEVYDAPSISLVRCAECKHQWREHKVCAHEANVVEGVCGKRAEDNDFCSYGERRDDE